MKFEAQFEQFLENTVNLSNGRITKLNQKVGVVESFIENLDPETGLVLIEAKPQGSFAQKTIINPVKTGEFDADLLVEFNDWTGEPKDLLLAVRAAFKASHNYQDIVGLKSRCVTLNYAGDFHLDVVPCVKEGPIPYIANRSDNGWEPTDPEGFTAWMEEQDGLANGHLIPTIRLVKYLRAFKGRPAAKSVVLAYLLARRVGARFSGDFEDLPATLTLLLEDVASWCQQFGDTAPILQEPTCGAKFRVDDLNWGAFTRGLQGLGDRARAALDEDDQEKSLALWRKLFGDKFPTPTEPLIKEAALAPGEQDLYRDFGIPTLLEGETVSIKAEVRAKAGFRGGLIRRLGRLHKSRRLMFSIERTSVARPYDVYWKVKNTGEDARRANGLRGEIKRDDKAEAYREESTLYAGDHYVEIYIVKDGVCVASARESVEISTLTAT